MIGLVVVLINVALVVGLVAWLQGGPDLTSLDDSSSTSSEPSNSSSTSEKPKFAEPRTVLDDDKDPFVTVLGGDEGVGEGGWVQSMASQAAQRHRRVNYSALDPQDPTKYESSSGDGEGKRLGIRNGSIKGSSPSYATNRLRFLLPGNTDVVVISYHPTSAKGVDHDLNDLLKKVKGQARKATVTLVLGPNAADGSGRTVRKRQRDWAERNGVPTIDVHHAFSKASGQELRSEWEDTHLTAQGSDLWARTVLARLIGAGKATSTSTSTTEPVPPVEPTTETTTEPAPTDTLTETAPVEPEPTVTSERTYVPPAPTSTYNPPPQPTESPSDDTSTTSEGDSGTADPTTDQLSSSPSVGDSSS